MTPARSSACAVVSNGMRESSHLHLSFAAGSSMGFGAGLVVMKFLRARYSSTLKLRSHGKTNCVLLSRHPRDSRPLPVQLHHPRRPRPPAPPNHQTQHSKQAPPPHHTEEQEQNAQLAAPAQPAPPQN